MRSEIGQQVGISSSLAGYCRYGVRIAKIEFVSMGCCAGITRDDNSRSGEEPSAVWLYRFAA